MNQRTIFITEFDLQRLKEVMRDSSAHSRDRHHYIDLERESGRARPVSPDQIPSVHYSDWTREQLIEALEEAKQQILELRAANDEYRWLEGALKKRTHELNERVLEIDTLRQVRDIPSAEPVTYSPSSHAVVSVGSIKNVLGEEV
jgi:hypothetical protein